MPDAKLELPGGALVTITGSAEEIADILQRVGTSPSVARDDSATSSAARPRKTGKRRVRASRQVSAGPREFLLELKHEGFFRGERRTLQDVISELATRGHIVPRTTVAPNLLRATKNRELRRLKENGHWVYTSE
jgi:hypothetical protein